MSFSHDRSVIPNGPFSSNSKVGIMAIYRWRRFHLRFHGFVGPRFGHARDASSNLRGSLCHASVQRCMEMGRYEDQRSAIERQDGGMVAAARAIRPSEASSVCLPRWTSVSARGRLSRRSHPRFARFLWPRWKRGTSWLVGFKSNITNKFKEERIFRNNRDNNSWNSFSSNVRLRYNLLSFAEKLGYALVMDLAGISIGSLRDGILKVAAIHNNSYRTAAKKRSTLLRDLPINPRKLATWWVEHVAKYKGEHLKSSTR